ncbi:TolC family protein [Salinispirillum sp. LH 10-3-1]|uniref:TolC family protein n=1 Tax=Salinispirillum sp. LH 10-3-1 TaxID=2952525 RepID=A0AB38YJZ2_9GAMM
MARRISATVGICLLSWPLLLGAEPLSLGQAQQRAQSASGALQANVYELQAWQERASATQWLRAPRVTWSATGLAYEKTIDVQYQGAALLPGMTQLAVDEVIAQQGVRSQLAVQLPVYTGGRISATQQQAAARVTQAEAEHALAMEQVERRVIDRYFDVQLARELERIRWETQNVLAGHRHRAERFEQEGMVSRLQAMQAHVAHDQSMRQWRAAQQQRFDAESALMSLLGTTELSCLTTPLQVVKVSDLSDPGDRAHPAMQALLAAERQAVAQVTVERSARKPEVFAFGVAELNRSMAALNDPDWAVGVGMQWQLSSGVNRRALAQAAEAQASQTRALQAQTQQDLMLARAVGQGRFEHSIEALHWLTSDLALTEENARLQEAAFAAGQATSLDVTDAWLQVAVGRLEKAQLQHQHLNALADWLQAQGALADLDSVLMTSSTSLCEER